MASNWIQYFTAIKKLADVLKPFRRKGNCHKGRRRNGTSIRWKCILRQRGLSLGTAIKLSWKINGLGWYCAESLSLSSLLNLWSFMFTIYSCMHLNAFHRNLGKSRIIKIAEKSRWSFYDTIKTLNNLFFFLQQCEVIIHAPPPFLNKGRLASYRRQTNKTTWAAALC